MKEFVSEIVGEITHFYCSFQALLKRRLERLLSLVNQPLANSKSDCCGPPWNIQFDKDIT